MSQQSNRSSAQCRTNYGAKFNFSGIKKIEGIPKFFFLKGRQIKNFKLLLRWRRTTLTLRWRRPCSSYIYIYIYCNT